MAIKKRIPGILCFMKSKIEKKPHVRLVKGDAGTASGMTKVFANRHPEEQSDEGSSEI